MGIRTAYMREWRAKNPEKRAVYGRRYLYGLSDADFAQMLKDQGGLCKLCSEKPAACVDHDHSTGRVRGLLCQGCNTGLGRFKDDPARLARAIEYLNGA